MYNYGKKNDCLWKFYLYEFVKCVFLISYNKHIQIDCIVVDRNIDWNIYDDLEDDLEDIWLMVNGPSSFGDIWS